MHGVGVLRSRLRPPRVPSGAIARPALLSACLRGVDVGRLLVVAGAGFGKSALLAQMVQATPLPVVWCSCDERMGSPAVLARHLTAAVGERVPGFGSGWAGSTDPDAIATDLCNEIDATISDDLVVVLDDVHHLDGTDAARVLGRLMGDLPPTVRLVVAGRRLPPGIDEGTSSTAIRLTEERLALTADQSSALLLAAGFDLPAPRLLDLHRHTEGWPAGLLIAAQSASDLDGVEAPGAPLFEYLAREVLGRLDAGTLRFLEDTANLSRLTPRLCAEVVGTSVEAAHAQLNRLSDAHLFTQRMEGTGDWFRYHHLLAEHLTERLRAADPRRVREIHRRAGLGWIAVGEPTEGLRHLLLAGAPEELADGIERFGRELVTRVDPAEMLAWVHGVPAQHRLTRPGLLLAHATGAQPPGTLRGRVRTHRGCRGAPGGGGRPRRSRLDFAARLGVQSVDRSTWWWRLVALAGLERWDELAAGLDTAKSVTAMSSHFWYRMRGPDALLAAQRGDRTAVVGLAEAAVAEIRERGEGFDQPWVLCDLSTALLRIGEDERAAALARDAVALAARLGLPWDEARSALRLALACPEPECAEALARALALTAEWGFDDLWVRRERRDAAQGLARALTAGAGPQGFAARLAVSCGGEVLEGVADRLEGAPADVRERFAGSLASASGGVEIAVRFLGDAAPAVRTAARAVPMGSPAAGRPPIHVRAIGGLSVERGGVPVPGSAFGRDKARQLMAALLSAGGPTHREVLLEWLWPELDPVRATRVFHVTLHALRRTLEPDLRPRAPSSLVVLEGDAYRVVLTDGDRFDVAELLDLARVRPGEDPEVRITRLQRATVMPPDEVFPEWPYADWVTGIRARVAEARRTVRHTLGVTLLECGRPAEAAVQLGALVALEPECEEWHRLLMRAQAAAGERALALRQFHACRARLRRELAIEVSPETRDLYTRILRDEVPGVAAPARSG